MDTPRIYMIPLTSKRVAKVHIVNSEWPESRPFKAVAYGEIAYLATQFNSGQSIEIQGEIRNTSNRTEYVITRMRLWKTIFEAWE